MIVKTKLPINSLLTNSEEKYDYVDSFSGTCINNNNTLKAEDVCEAFFSSSPKWVKRLFTLRNKLASVVGLKTSGKILDRQKELDNFKCEPGERLGLFKVFNKTDNEVVLGEDDKHLNFRVSLLIDKSADEARQKNLIISTTVKFNNWFGRVYFFPVRLFHKFIVPSILNAIIKNLNNRNH